MQISHIIIKLLYHYDEEHHFHLLILVYLYRKEEEEEEEEEKEREADKGEQKREQGAMKGKESCIGKRLKARRERYRGRRAGGKGDYDIILVPEAQDQVSHS